MRAKSDMVTKALAVVRLFPRRTYVKNTKMGRNIGTAFRMSAMPNAKE